MASNEESRKSSPRGISFLTTRAVVALIVAAGTSLGMCGVATAQESGDKAHAVVEEKPPLYDENADAKQQIVNPR